MMQLQAHSSYTEDQPSVIFHFNIPFLILHSTYIIILIIYTSIRIIPIILTDITLFISLVNS